MGECEEATFGVGISTTIKHVYEIMGDEKPTGIRRKSSDFG